jgi:hypothetical protein
MDSLDAHDGVHGFWLSRFSLLHVGAGLYQFHIWVESTWTSLRCLPESLTPPNTTTLSLAVRMALWPARAEGGVPVTGGGRCPTRDSQSGVAMKTSLSGLITCAGPKANIHSGLFYLSHLGNSWWRTWWAQYTNKPGGWNQIWFVMSKRLTSLKVEFSSSATSPANVIMRAAPPPGDLSTTAVCHARGVSESHRGSRCHCAPQGAVS